MIESWYERSIACQHALGSACGRSRLPLFARKGCDTADFAAGGRAAGVTPHVARNTMTRRSAIDGRTTRYAADAISLQPMRAINLGRLRPFPTPRSQRFGCETFRRSMRAACDV